MQKPMWLPLGLVAALQLCASAAEEESVLCTARNFWCQDGHRVSLCAWCDGKPDCRDGSDESSCRTGNATCGLHGRPCGGEGPCLPLANFCNGFKDCPDGSDEAAETCHHQTAMPLLACPEEGFRCAPGAECFPQTWVCDGHPDCEDERDELNCSVDLSGAVGIPQATEMSNVPSSKSVLLGLAEDLVVVTIVALLSVLMASICVALWGRRKAALQSTYFGLQSREQLMGKEQP